MNLLLKTCTDDLPSLFLNKLVVQRKIITGLPELLTVLKEEIKVNCFLSFSDVQTSGI